MNKRMIKWENKGHEGEQSERIVMQTTLSEICNCNRTESVCSETDDLMASAHAAPPLTHRFIFIPHLKRWEQKIVDRDNARLMTVRVTITVTVEKTLSYQNHARQVHPGRSKGSFTALILSIKIL